MNYDKKPCWLMKGCPSRTGVCYSCEPDGDDCPIWRWFKKQILLKEQEAIEPDVDSEGTCSCGNCGTTVGYYPAGCNIPEKLYKYCPECGHGVKWK